MPLDFQADALIWILGVFVLVCVLIYAVSRRLFTLVSPAAAWGIVGIRIAAAAALLTILGEPASRMLLERTESPGVAVLVDTSTSMGISDRLGRRNETLAAVWTSDAFNTIRARDRVLGFRFAEDLSPLPEDRDGFLETDGVATDIGAALAFVKNGSRTGRFAAAILVSDGNFTGGRDPLRVAEDIDVPLYTVGIGDTLDARDISVSRLTVNEVAYAGSNVPVEVVVSGRGYGRVRVPVTLREAGRILQSREIVLDERDGNRTVVFHVAPDSVGLHRYQVELPALDGEVTATNNRRVFAIKVLKSDLRILYLEGAPRADMGFLRRTLERDASVDLTSIVFRPDGTTYPESMPASRKDWFSYDLLILGSVDYERMRPWAHMLVSFVEERGGGLIALGGPRSFETGGYAGTAIGNLLPFEIAAMASGMTGKNFVPELTADGLAHPVTRLGDDPAESQRRWAELPPLPEMNPVGRAKRGATVLVSNPAMRTGQGDAPVIAVHRYGQGSVLGIAAHGLWHWDLMMWGSGGTNAAYERFWNNAVRWITVREGSRRIRVASDKLQYQGGEGIRFDGQIYDENYRPVAHADLSVTVRSEQEEEDTVQLNLSPTEQGRGRYAGRLQFLPAGAYTFEATAALKGVTMGTDRGRFVVGEAGAEYERTRMNQKLLVQLADMTGGRFYLPSEIGRMVEDVDLDEVTVQETHILTLWDHPVVLMLLLGLIVAEWLMRRNIGML